MKKRILFITESLATGVQSYLTDLSNGLAGEFDVYLAYSVRSNQTNGNFRSFFDSRVHFIEVRNFCRELNPVSDIRAFFEIRRIAQSVKPDIIHLHSSKAGALGRFAFNGRKVPLFYTPHGYSFVAEECGRLRKFIYRTIEWICARRKCTTIDCGKGEYEDTLRLTERCICINNGINIEQIENIVSSSAVEEHPFTVYTLGRICYQKDPFVFNRIAESLPDVNFLWIGDGELRDELKSPNIRVTGFLDRKKALETALGCDCFLFTSFGEALPMSLLESMYLRKPCVVSDVKGNHDVVKDGISGYLCKSVDDYVCAIRKVQSSDNTDLTENAFSDILNEYNTRVMCEKYREVYMKAMEESPDVHRA